MQVAISPVLPGGLARLLFWARCVPLPLLTLWADYAAWVPSTDDGMGSLAGDGDVSRTRRHLQRNIARVRSVSTPPRSRRRSNLGAMHTYGMSSVSVCHVLGLAVLSGLLFRLARGLHAGTPCVVR
jgi:hypothetical protein